MARVYDRFVQDGAAEKPVRIVENKAEIPEASPRGTGEASLDVRRIASETRSPKDG
jgi:hypothetical protein